jgi:predicted nucleotidyltransferase component of viral defense system
VRSVLLISSVKAELHEADKLQRVVASLIARSPAGVNLLLIGGFRYRLLDNSQRFSVDIDYHWGGDLEAKQRELLSLCRRVILGQVRRELSYEGSATARTGPDADSPNAKFIDLRFWKDDVHVEIPLELTQIVCLDPPTIRTAGGTVHATPSDTDLIESKLIAVLNRLFLQHRDLVDVFLFADHLRPDSPARVTEKLGKLQLRAETVARRLKDLQENREYHATAIQKVIDEQMDSTVVQQMTAGGGGRTVLDSALSVLLRVCRP